MGTPIIPDKKDIPIDLNHDTLNKIFTPYIDHNIDTNMRISKKIEENGKNL